MDKSNMSMKKTEIQVGNWVRLNDPLQSGVAQVIGYFNGVVATKSETGSAKVRVENIEPILITEDFLLANSFDAGFDDIFHENFYEATIKGFELVVSKGGNMGEDYWHVHIDNEDRCTVANANIRYVHQLQNLLSLIGVEWEAEL